MLQHLVATAREHSLACTAVFTSLPLFLCHTSASSPHAAIESWQKLWQVQGAREAA